MFKDYFIEGTKITWEGGSDSYEDARKIENLITRYDFYAHMINSYAQQKEKMKKNKAIKDALKKLGVTKIVSGKDHTNV